MSTKTAKTFGWRPGAKIHVEFDDRYLSVKGSLGADRARVAITDVETATVTVSNMGQGPANMRQTYLQLIGRGTVLGQAAVTTMAGKAGAADEAAEWIRGELARRRAPANYGLRSGDGRWWWDGQRWIPLQQATG
ncbi:MAG TPA: hypothetical protein VFR68_09015 [Candidatus Dormibacteraeota bacterium]|nr:hypothetical protein [Candidatus Dormibacteraeota bacterium]